MLALRTDLETLNDVDAFMLLLSLLLLLLAFSLFRCCCFPPFCLPPAYKSSLAASCAHFWTLSIAASSHAPHQWCPPCINIRFSHHQQSIPTIQLILRYHHCSLHNNTNALVEVTMISHITTVQENSTQPTSSSHWFMQFFQMFTLYGAQCHCPLTRSVVVSEKISSNGRMLLVI